MDETTRTARRPRAAILGFLLRIVDLLFRYDFFIHAGWPSTPRLQGHGEYEANEGISIRAIRRKLGVI